MNKVRRLGYLIHAVFVIGHEREMDPGQGPKEAGPVPDQGPNRPAPKWAQGLKWPGRKSACVKTQQGPNGPGPKPVRAQMCPAKQKLNKGNNGSEHNEYRMKNKLYLTKSID